MRKETLLEMIAGRLNVLYAHDPDRAEFIVNSIIDAMAVPGVRREGQDMRKTYKIELKIDFEDEKRHKIATHLMRKAARGILTQATLIADGREPQVAFISDDFFEGGTQESLAELSDMPEEVGDGVEPEAEQ